MTSTYIDKNKQKIYQELLVLSNYKDANFYKISKIFERYCSIILTEKYSSVFMMYEDVDLKYKEDNDLTSCDTGIDLLCCEKNMISQVKLRQHILYLKDLGTTSLSSWTYDEVTDKPAFRWNKSIILSRNSSCRLSKHLQHHISIKIIEDNAIDMNDFYTYCDNLLKSPPRIENVNKKVYEDRDYQKEAISLIKNTVNKNIFIQLPTGSGKSYIIIKSFDKNKKYLILVPLCNLLEQFYEEICNVRPELKNSINKIGDGNNIIDANKNITICVYNSVEIVGDLTQYDKVHIDEAHRIYRPFIYIDNEDEDNDEEDIQDTYITSIRKHVNNNKNSVLHSATLDKPDDDSEYYRVELRDLIERDILSDYKINIPIFDKGINYHSIAKHIIEQYRNTIIYSSTREHGLAFNNIMNKLYPNSCEYVDCKTNRKKLKDILKRFRNGKLLFLVNVRILIEGFDAPIASSVCLLNISKNDKMIIQIIGRILRKHPLKTIASIILPFCDRNEEKELNYILRVLCDNDDVIRDRCSNKKLGGYINICKGNVDEHDKDEEEEEIETDEVNEDEDIYNILYEMVYDSVGNLLKGNQEKWFNKLQKLIKYIESNNRRPSFSSKDKLEKQLAYWINDNQKRCKDNIRKHCMIDDDIYNRWITFKAEYSELFLTYKEIWFNILQKLIQFIDTNKRRPSRSSKDKFEKQLGCWIQNNQKNFKDNIRKQCMKDDDIYNRWVAFKDEYSELFLTSKEIWFNRLQKLILFIDTNKKRPSEKSKDKFEKQLAEWINTNQQNCKDNIRKQCMKDDEIYNRWIAFKAEYSELFITSKEIWFNTLQKLIQFIDTNNRRPSQYSKDEVEKQLAVWVGTNQTNCKDNIRKKCMKDDEIYNRWITFNNEYSEIFLTSKEIWFNTLQKLIQFIDTNKRRPSESQYSKDKFEKQLAKWIDHNQTYCKDNIRKQCMKDDDIYNRWVAFKDEYSELFLTSKEIWFNRLQKLILFIDTNKKRPSEKSKDKFEKQLAEWINTNQQNCKDNIRKQCMKDDEIYNRWIAFKAEYSELF